MTAEKIILITGASTGIGRACADLLSLHGHTVIGASRRPPVDVGWSAITMDVDDDASVTSGVERVLAEHGSLDAVVACAGWGLAGAVEQTPLSDAKAQFETNFFGAVRTARETLPALRATKGRLVLMSSIGGAIGLPFQAYYSASKFALEGWAEALALEVKPHGVHVTLVEPGNFRTEFTSSRRTVRTEDDDPYKDAQEKAIGVMERDERNGADPAAVAKCVEKVLNARRPPRRVSAGPMGERVGLLAKRLLPSRVFEAASASSLGV
jgi:NAD(P)-dependent dehydrogenase (short-subunit alcohol dehydrogenase family)